VTWLENRECTWLEKEGYMTGKKGMTWLENRE
jgi:hypothetical protein